MKIIGQNERDGFIVIITKEEIAKLSGFGSAYCAGFNADGLKCGAVVEIGAIYGEAYEALNNHKVAIESAKKLQSSATRFLSFFKEEDQKGAK